MRAGTEKDWIRLVLTGAHPSTREASRSRHELDAAGAFIVLPSTANPRLLLPLDSPKAAAAALRTHGYGAGAAERLVRTALRIGVRAGLAQRIFRPRVSISSASTKPAPLVEHLREVLARSDLDVAIRLGRLRPNRKPVVQVLSRDGQLVAFAKLGWNDVTRRLVANEAGVLRALMAREPAPRSFVAPRVLHFGRWRDLGVLVLSPLPGAPLSRARARRDPPLEATREIAALEPERRAALAESDYWRARRARIDRADEPTLGRLGERLEDRYGEEVVPLGAWHGDWTPWNIASGDGAVSVWDWERSGGLVPVDLDAAHYDVHLALAARRLESSAGRAGPLLTDLRVPAKDAERLVALDLFEMVLRREEGRQAGMRLVNSPHSRTIEELLKAAR